MVGRVLRAVWLVQGGLTLAIATADEREQDGEKRSTDATAQALISLMGRSGRRGAGAAAYWLVEVCSTTTDFATNATGNVVRMIF